jgi:hypothetical protein
MEKEVKYMLTNSTYAVTLPVVDLERAKNLLGLKESGDMPNGLMFETGKGQMIMLYQREPTKADHTVLDFEVDDIETEIKELQDKGVVFEDYDMPDLKTENHIATMGQWKAAWFKDSEGNILSINQTPK